MPLCEVLELPAAEVDVWSDWYAVNGFPDDRAEAGRAMAGAYVGAVWGGKATAAELRPRFGPQKKLYDPAGVKAWFDRRMVKGE